MRDYPLPSHCPAIIVQPARQGHATAVSTLMDEATRRVRSECGLPSYTDAGVLRRLRELIAGWLVTQGIRTERPQVERVVR